ARGEERAEVTVNPAQLQPWGLVNGGVFSSIAESVGSLAGVVQAGAVVVGVNNNTDFLKSVRNGVIEARATPIHAGRRSQVWNVALLHDGQLVALSKLRTKTLGSQIDSQLSIYATASCFSGTTRRSRPR